VADRVESGPADVEAVTVRVSGRWPTGSVQDAENDAVSDGVHVWLGALVKGVPSVEVRRSNERVTGRSRALSGRAASVKVHP